MVVVVLYQLCSVLYFAYLVNAVGHLLAMVSSRSKAAAAGRAKLEEVEVWMGLEFAAGPCLRVANKSMHLIKYASGSCIKR